MTTLISSRACMVLVTMLGLLSTTPSVAQTNDYYRQQQQQQQQADRQRQDQQRQQEQQRQRDQAQQAERQRVQDQMRQQQQQAMRQQMQDQARQQQQQAMRQQMQQQAQAQQRQQAQDQQRRQTQDQQRQAAQTQQRSQTQQQQQQNQQRQQQASQRQQQQTAEQQRAQAQADGKLGKDSKPTGMAIVGGVAKMNRPLTPGEISRGFTGKVTPDGRALVRFQNRVFTVPASRISGLNARLAQQSQQRSARWTAQQQATVNQRLKSLSTSKEERNNNSGGCTPPENLNCKFNEAAAKRSAPVQVAYSVEVQRRIDAAKGARTVYGTGGPSSKLGRLDYSSSFEGDLKNFNAGHVRISGPLKEDLILVQYHKDVPLGEGRSAAWWTSHLQANELSTENGVRGKLALPPDWGGRGSVSVARIPKGTIVEYEYGTSKVQRSEESNITYLGGGKQYRFKYFDSSWITETRRMDSK